MKHLILILFTLLPAVAFAAPDVKMKIIAEIEITETIDGQDVKKRVKANDTVSGDVIFYTLSFENKGDEPAENVAFVDAIPDGTEYIDGTVFGAGTSITFSVDAGETYKPASLLTYEVSGEKKSISPEKYSHIRWQIKKLDAGKSGVAGFQVRVK